MKIFAYLYLLLLFLSFGCKKDKVTNLTSSVTATITSAQKDQANRVAVTWKAELETYVQMYTLERSADSLSFSAVTTVAPGANNGSTANFTTYDSSPISGTSFYRVKVLVSGGQIKYSNILRATCPLNSVNFAGTYRVTSMLYKADFSSPEIDVYPTLDACQKDDHVVFNSNNTTDYVDFGQTCSPPGNSTGTWSLSGSVVDIDGDQGQVTAFDCSGMKIKIVTDPLVGETITVTLVKL